LNKRFIIDGVLDLLGPICIDCGELNRHFLTVDHKLNNGNEERHLSSIGWKRRILNGQSNKDDYQILCFNCNLGKYRLNPTNHQKGRQIIGELILCPKCLFEKDRSEFSNDLSKNRSCFECQRFMDTFVKVKTINFVGGKCACCGMSEPHKLTIDHIKGDGWYRRKFLSEGSGVDFYKKILNHTIDSKGFQILCWNCNMSKHINNGVCLHQMLFKSEKLNRNRPTLTKNNNSSENKDFNFINITIIKGSNLQSKKLFKDYHYNKFGRPQTAIYSAILDDKVIAAVKFCTPVRLEVATTLGYEYKDVIELDRFCIHPEYQKKNFASWLMSRVVKQFKTDFPDIKALVSFADTRFGHVGTIYKASNWKELGQTSPSYVYVDLDGNEINKKTLYGYAKRRNMKERECADRLGLKKVPTPPKIKYIYEL
jgi:GNAT superfamily N-acetyltransferase